MKVISREKTSIFFTLLSYVESSSDHPTRDLCGHKVEEPSKGRVIEVAPILWYVPGAWSDDFSLKFSIFSRSSLAVVPPKSHYFLYRQAMRSVRASWESW